MSETEKSVDTGVEGEAEAPAEDAATDAGDTTETESAPSEEDGA